MGATSGTALDSDHTQGLMLNLQPEATVITAIESPSSERVSRKSNPTLGHTVVYLHINKELSLYDKKSMIGSSIY